MPGPEARVRTAIRRRLNSLAPHGKFVAYAAGPYGQRGVGDFFGCFKGRFISIEVKALGKKPTPLQAFTMEQWQAAGGVAFCVESVAGLECYWKNLLHEEMPTCPMKKSSKSKSPSPPKPSSF